MKQAAKEIGSKEHNDEEGNRPSDAEDMDLKEDSEGEETYHYGEDEGRDDRELRDLVKRHATKAHIDALKRDMDYDEDHEDRHERGTDFREGMPSDDVARIKSRKYLKGPGSDGDLDPSGVARLDYEEDPAGWAGPGRIPGLDDEDGGSKSKRRKAFAKQFKEGIFSPNHYCVHHGGVQHEGQIKMAEAISHNFDKKLNKVTWYNMKLQDGTILEQVATEDIQVTSASLAEMHHAHRVEDEDEESGMHKQSEKDPADYTGTRKREKRAISALKKGKGLEETASQKISVREAKEITRRIIERIRKEGK